MEADLSPTLCLISAVWPFNFSCCCHTTLASFIIAWDLLRPSWRLMEMAFGGAWLRDRARHKPSARGTPSCDGSRSQRRKGGSGEMSEEGPSFAVSPVHAEIFSSRPTINNRATRELMSHVIQWCRPNTLAQIYGRQRFNERGVWVRPAAEFHLQLSGRGNKSAVRCRYAIVRLPRPDEAPESYQETFGGESAMMRAEKDRRSGASFPSGSRGTSRVSFPPLHDPCCHKSHHGGGVLAGRGGGGGSLLLLFLSCTFGWMHPCHSDTYLSVKGLMKHEIHPKYSM